MSPRAVNGMKVCCGCRRNLPIAAFTKRHTAPDGKKYKCRDCEKIRHRLWLAANPGKARASEQAYRIANPEKVRASERAYAVANREMLRRKALASWRKQQRAKWELRWAMTAESLLGPVQA